jgi:predicted KAP-like P-loop ATPase
MKWPEMFKRKARPVLSEEPNLSSHVDDQSSHLSKKTDQLSVAADNPIRDSSNDGLGRNNAARSFAANVLALDASEGVVVGVLGAWGSGKTSFINLARAEFKKAKVPILDFNPWMFSGAEQLVQSFFSELSAQLKVRPGLEEIGKGLESYGEIFSGLTWLPFVGPWIEQGQEGAKLLADLLQRKKEGIAGHRKRVENALGKLERPILIVLDDIDRLNTTEIRDIFRLVRLTANFPNVIYILAFDRKRVEQALSEQGIPGRAYLEKILQVGMDLPAVPEQVLNTEIFKAIDAALNSVEKKGAFDESRWPDVFMETIRPLVSNMRDVRRYSAAISGTVRELGDQVALVDVLALEAVRIFLPDSFMQMQNSLRSLTTIVTSGYRSGGDSPELKAQVEALVSSAGERRHVITSLIEHLFPAGQGRVGGMVYGHDWKSRWLTERRVAHEDVLRLYLERVAGEGLQAFTNAERAWQKMSSGEGFDAFLRTVEKHQLQDVIASLENFEDKYTPEQVVPGTVVLYNILPEIPERHRGMFDFDASMVVSRVTYRLLRSLKDPAKVELAVRTILPALKTLSGKLHVINTVGYREGVGHKLVTEVAATDLEANWRQEVRLATVETMNLAMERELLRVFLTAQTLSSPSESPLAIPLDPKLTIALLLSARSETRSQTMGSRAVRRTTTPAWDMVEQIFGGNDSTKKRIEAIVDEDRRQNEELIALAEKYADGWRPPDDRHD